MNKRNKIILIVSSSIASAVVTYFGGGLIATSIAEENMINVRGSDMNSLLNDDFYKTQYIQKDFPLLQEREIVEFSCGKETLVGYLYKVNNPKGIIITAHGVTALADGNHAQYQNYFVEKGWDVFAIDLTGCGRSSGKGMKTLHESRHCVANAIKTIKNREDTKELPLFLFGHSWGAYGVVTATEDEDDIQAVAALSGYNQSAGVMYGFVENYVSPALIVTKPALDFSLAVLHGDKDFFKAATAIKHNPNTTYIIVHGDNDDVVPLKNYSIYDNVDENKYSNVKKILLEDFKHSSPWNTNEAVNYYEDILEPGFDALHEQYGEEIPEDVLNEYLSTIDKEKASELNTDLLEKIESTFASKGLTYSYKE